MAFSRRAFSREQQAKSFSDVSIVVTPGFCGIIVPGALDQANHQVMHSGKNSSSSANRYAGGIFAKSNISPIM